MKKFKLKKICLLFTSLFICFIGCKASIEPEQVPGIPNITAISEDVITIINNQIKISVIAENMNNGLLTYQWYSAQTNSDNGVQLEGKIESSFFPDVCVPGVTYYYCEVTNILDGKSKSITSSRIRFEVLDSQNIKPIIIKQPVSMNIAPFNQTVTLSCDADLDNYEIAYKWYRSLDGTTASRIVVPDGYGADTSTYTTPVFTEKGVYYYFCEVTTILAQNESSDVNNVTSVSDVVSVAYTGLPTIIINTGSTKTSDITKETYVLGDFTLISEDYGTTEYTFSKVKNGEIKEGLKGRGNTTWTMPKKGYNFKFDTKQSFFNLPAAKKWCIIANYSDKSLLRNRVASLIGNDILNKEWNPTFNTVDVVMNGEYLGNYIFCERNTLSSGRVDVQDIADVDEKIAGGKEAKVDDVNNDGVKDLFDGGFLIEVEGKESRASDNDFYFASTKGGRFFCLKDPDEVSEAVQERVKSVVLNAENILYSDEYTDTENGWRKYIDEDSVIDWYLINELAKNNDAIFFSSVYMYYNPKDAKLHLGPIWDFDISCGNINYNNSDVTEGFWIKNAIWISRMFTDSTFVNNVKARWNEKKYELYSLINSEIQSLSDGISVSAEYNFEKWNILGQYVWPNAEGYEERTTYTSEVEYLINWLNSRYNWLDSAINGL